MWYCKLFNYQWMMVGIGLLLCLCHAAAASSFRSNGLGARARGMGGAYVALADDTTAGYWNPAGLAFAPTRLTQLELKADRIAAAYTPPGGDREQNKVSTLIIPALGAIIPLGNDRWPSAALLAYVPYGQQLGWDEDAAYRYNVTYDKIRVLSLGSATAYRMNNRLALGAGLFINDTRLRLENKVPSTVYAGAPDLPDASFTATGQDSVVNYHLGALWLAQPSLRVGAAYRAPMDLALHGGADLLLPDGTDITDEWRLPLQLPQSLSLGLAWQHTPTTLYAVQADWVDWSVIETQRFTFVNGALPDSVTARDWHDRVQWRAGVEHQAGHNLTVRAGYSYDPSPVPASTLDPQLLDVDRHILSAGLGVKSSRWAYDLSYEHFFGQPRTTTTSVHAFPTNGNYTGKVDVLILSISTPI